MSCRGLRVCRVWVRKEAALHSNSIIDNVPRDPLFGVERFGMKDEDRKIAALDPEVVQLSGRDRGRHDHLIG